VLIVTAATGFTSKNGMNYILVFPGALCMPKLDHSLFNPNQLHHFGTVVQDNRYDAKPMSIKSADNTFTACLDSAGTDIFLKMWAPSDADLRMYPSRGVEFQRAMVSKTSAVPRDLASRPRRDRIQECVWSPDDGGMPLQ
jgi:hypothetical protein